VKRLDRYVARHVVGATALAWLLVTAMDALVLLLGELGDIGRGQYQLADAARYVLLSAPAAAWRLFPVSALLGALLGLGTLAAHGELVALRLAGFSRPRLLRSVLQAGVLMLVLVVALGETLAPAAERQARLQRALALFDRVALAGEQGLWVRDGSRFVHVAALDADGGLAGVSVFDFGPDRRLRSSLHAERARHDGDGWRLLGVQESLFVRQGVETRRSARLAWRTTLTPTLVKVLALDPDAMALGELQRYIRHLRASGLDAAPYRMAYWSRLAAPLSALAMLALAVAFVLREAGRGGAGRRLFAGILVGLLYTLLDDLLAQAGLVYGLPAPAVAVLPSLLVGGAAFALLGGRGARPA